MSAWTPEKLDSSSLVPLYYQLYEAIKEAIDSGYWPAGGMMPSEPDLMRIFGISRIVVRQALSILEDDGQILRVRGRGTFVAPAKLTRRAGGLARNLIHPRTPDLTLRILDNRRQLVPPSIRAGLCADEHTDIVRITTLLSVNSLPVAISYSYFTWDDAGELATAARVGQLLPPELRLGVRLAHSTAAVEVSDACKFEADQLGIPLGSTVLVALCTEFKHLDDRVVPLEMARVIYRGSALRLSMASTDLDERDMEAGWDVIPSAPG